MRQQALVRSEQEERERAQEEAAAREAAAKEEGRRLRCPWGTTPCSATRGGGAETRGFAGGPQVPRERVRDWDCGRVRQICSFCGTPFLAVICRCFLTACAPGTAGRGQPPWAQRVVSHGCIYRNSTVLYSTVQYCCTSCTLIPPGRLARGGGLGGRAGGVPSVATCQTPQCAPTPGWRTSTSCPGPRIEGVAQGMGAAGMISPLLLEAMSTQSVVKEENFPLL